MSNWIKNAGGMIEKHGTLVDVRYRDGRVNYHVHAGWANDTTGSITPLNASDWSIDGSDMDIVEWRLHGAPEVEQSTGIKLDKIKLLCAMILEQDRIATEWVAGEEPSREEQNEFVRLDSEIVALAKVMIDLEILNNTGDSK